MRGGALASGLRSGSWIRPKKRKIHLQKYEDTLQNLKSTQEVVPWFLVCSSGWVVAVHLLNEPRFGHYSSLQVQYEALCRVP